jgi:alkanesulfonate monooxygenase SsuD/methylene tetrahydromethanopterin reductase-like flavin-dependent oxidoreductase (luciferase family)
VQGALQTPRPPQGYPVFVQAGSSADGQALAAETAELVFTAQQTEEARAFYQGLKAQLPAHGRAPDALKICPACRSSWAAARPRRKNKYQALQS